MNTSILRAPAVRGASWMMAAGLGYAATGALVRLVAQDYPVFEVVFLRCVIALAVLAPMIRRLGLGALKTEQPAWHGLRAVLGYVGILLWFYGVSVIPLADYYALQFTMPLFTIAGAALLLRERVDTVAWIAVGVGFLGALVILRPGLAAVSLGAVAALGAALMFAGANICIRIMSRKDDTTVIVVYSNLLVLPLALVPALFDWVTPAWRDVPGIIGIGVMGTLAQFAITRAVGIAEARIVQPFDFARLPFAAVIGWLLFHEAMDLYTWLGAVIIFCAAYYVLRREPR
jgi:S-adenosylmethionine uptake transporter